MVFIITLGVEIIVYLSIHVILQELMLPWIGKGLSKLPYFRNKIKTSSLPVMGKEEINRNQIRKEYSLAELKKRNNTKTIAIQYTQTTFTPYLADLDIIRLCGYIDLYAERKEFKNLTLVKVNTQLTTIDIYHFGWNIWNHFKFGKVGKQDDMALFLKIVFAHTLREVEIETIKKHLKKDDEQKGIIKIKEDISN
ncbi:MAG: hypothetical protein EZS26_003858 [Candidatus Ordinivivax streblomastigis]|uniref:Uncharacterized protein n=1 Tax=Candidatus Ordinivivax streblomastigis TaxID=2540710 RepID=A0A5M8NUG6_9BACT|nr:MAG: hypothetical protein EZS26_003858 [Candidatus Ordinivivax streblomastigis]